MKPSAELPFCQLDRLDRQLTGPGFSVFSEASFVGLDRSSPIICIRDTCVIVACHFTIAGCLVYGAIVVGHVDGFTL